MQIKSRGLLFFIGLTLLSSLPLVSANSTLARIRDDQVGSPLLKFSIQVTAQRLVRYWKQPQADNYWTWMPRVGFNIIGPLNAGTVFVIDFTNPDGSPWYSVDCFSDSLPAGKLGGVGTPPVTTHIDNRSTLATGTFGLKIRMKNEVMGTNSTLFTGKFKVNKFHVGNALPAFKNQFEYYVDQDWTLPIGYLWFSPQIDANAPGLVATMWFRGELDDTKVGAYLFYNGKQIGEAKEQKSSAASDSKLMTSGNDKDPRWERWSFRWGFVRGYSVNTNDNSSLFLLSKNPGEYEIKVLREGELARSIKFAVGADGKIVDNSISKQNNLGWLGIVVPVKVIGNSDGTWEANAWKTDAFYGNPLTGFTAP